MFIMLNIKQYITEKLILAKQKTKYPAEEYFYHEALEDGYRTKLKDTHNALQYSIDDCKTWDMLEPGTYTPEINKGQRIYFKGEKMKVVSIYGIGRFVSNKDFNAGGNIMSLIYGDNFDGKTRLLQNNQFGRLFIENDYLESAKNLVLPAIVLTGECYASMFEKCAFLTTPPKLPATKLDEWCYHKMFRDCKSLKDAPELPASELTKYCYSNMFYGCESLTKAPKLLASGSNHSCYECMFMGCNLLNEITMLATDIYYGCLFSWVYKVSSSGTFTKAKGANIPTGKDGIPEGWTVKEI